MKSTTRSRLRSTDACSVGGMPSSITTRRPIDRLPGVAPLAPISNSTG